jgi:hypothetical protein
MKEMAFEMDTEYMHMTEYQEFTHHTDQNKKTGYAGLMLPLLASTAKLAAYSVSSKRNSEIPTLTSATRSR